MGDFVPERARVWAEIDRGALRWNLDFVRNRIGPGAGVIAVVKANAYGHGVREVVRCLRGGVGIFAVANVDEGIEVMDADPACDVLLLGPCLLAERAEAVARGFVVTVSSVVEAEAYAALAKGAPARVQLKIDSGMGRIGLWHEDALAAVKALAALPGVELHSVATHLPVSDEDPDFTREQLALFAEEVREMRAIAPGAKFHVLNSAGVFGEPEYALDLVRAGLMLYGSAVPAKYQAELRPALEWKTRVLLVRDLPAGRSISYGRTFITPGPMRVATLGVGYADGFPRQVSGKGACVLIGRRRCPVLGRVTMDQIVVDIGGVEGGEVGAEAVLIGSQGEETILAAELAGWADTIAWNIFTGIGGRTERFYFG